MPDGLYRVSVEIVLSDALDEGPMAVATAVVFGALDGAEIVLRRLEVERISDA